MRKTGESEKKATTKPLKENPRKETIPPSGKHFLSFRVGLIPSIKKSLGNRVGPMTATSFQYEIGKRGGSHYIRMAQKAGYDIKESKDVGLIAANLGTLGGWGKLSVEEIDFKKNFFFKQKTAYEI